MKINLPDEIIFVLNTFKENHFEAYVVGGAVRDFVMGIEAKDYDISTNATSQEILEIFKGHHFINNNGERHGTLTLRYHQINIEITSFKFLEDEQNDLISDANHRDLTMNSLYYDGENIIDPRHGIDDINNHLISMGNNPLKIINEDPLRILRAIRFSIKYHFDIEEKTKIEMLKNASLLQRISKERIEAEFKYIVEADNIKDIYLEYLPIFKIIFPEISIMEGYDQSNPYHKNDLLTHTLNVMNNVRPDYRLRLAAFYHDIGKPKCETIEIKEDGTSIKHFYKHPYVSKEIAESYLKEYKYSNLDISIICFLVMNHDNEIASTKRSVHKLVIKAKEVKYDTLELIEMLYNLKEADAKDHTTNNYVLNKDEILSIAKNILEEESLLSVRDLKINGHDLITLGYKGKELGEMLDLLLNEVIEEKLENKKEELLSFCQRKI